MGLESCHCYENIIQSSESFPPFELKPRRSKLSHLSIFASVVYSSFKFASIIFWSQVSALSQALSCGCFLVTLTLVTWHSCTFQTPSSSLGNHVKAFPSLLQFLQTHRSETLHS